MNTRQIVKFSPSRENTPMALVGGKIAFPEHNGQQPKIGETWEVEVAGTNPSGKVVFLHLLSKVELFEWEWNDQLGSRSRHPACLVVTSAGEVFRFTGIDIPNVVKIVKSDYSKQGKWSYTTYHCVSPQGTSIYAWKESFEEGFFWPQASWEEAFITVQKSCPQVDSSSLEAVIRQHWGEAAEKFDVNQKTVAAFAGTTSTADNTTTTVTHDDLALMGIEARTLVHDWAEELAEKVDKLRGNDLIEIAEALQRALAVINK